jgi:hypothetical protein
MSGWSRAIDLTGKTFGRLRVLARAGSDSYRNARWLCLCSCGRRLVVSGYHMRRGATSSCGCFRREVNAATMTERWRVRHLRAAAIRRGA